MALHTTLVAGMKLEPVGPLRDVLSQEQAWLCPSLCHCLPRSCCSEPGCAPEPVHHQGLRPSPGNFPGSPSAEAPQTSCIPTSESRGLRQRRGCSHGDALSLRSPLSASFAPEEQTVSVCNRLFCLPKRHPRNIPLHAVVSLLLPQWPLSSLVATKVCQVLHGKAFFLPET